MLAAAMHDVRANPEAWGAGSMAQLWLGRWDPELPFGVSGALGTALSVFLAFRNSSAYERWWEARRLWGQAVNESRTWARQVLCFLDPGAGEARRTSLVLGQVAWVHALRLCLRDQRHLLAEELSGLLPPEELVGIDRRTNPCNLLLLSHGRQIREALREGALTELHHLQLDETLTRLLAIQGGCERIKNTPLPRQYDTYPRVFTVLYTCLLPFGFASSVGWMCVILAPAVGALFILLERSGHVIENPFENRVWDTPMTSLCVTVERNLKEMLGSAELPAAVEVSPEGVLM